MLIGKSSLYRDVWSDGDTQSDLLGQPEHWSLRMLGPLTASKFVNGTCHTARDRLPQTAVSSIFYTVPVHITDVESPFPRTHACSRGNALLEWCGDNLLCGGKWEGHRVKTLLLTSKWMMSFTLHSWTLSMFHLLSFALSLTHIFLRTRWPLEIPSDHGIYICLWTLKGTAFSHNAVVLLLLGIKWMQKRQHNSCHILEICWWICK